MPNTPSDLCGQRQTTQEASERSETAHRDASSQLDRRVCAYLAGEVFSRFGVCSRSLRNSHGDGRWSQASCQDQNRGSSALGGAKHVDTSCHGVHEMVSKGLDLMIHIMGLRFHRGKHEIILEDAFEKST